MTKTVAEVQVMGKLLDQAAWYFLAPLLVFHGGRQNGLTVAVDATVASLV